MMRQRLAWLVPILWLVLWCAPGQAAALEKPRVTIAVGGKSALYYLPLALAERLGFFKEEGLEVEIADFAGGSKALQAMLGGSADVTAGGFDHVIVLQARGQKLQAFVLMLATPAISLGVVTAKAAQYRSPLDLKGMKIGVTAPGSSTHMFVNRVLASAGLSSEDVSIVGVGNGPTAIAAVRGGQIDAIANVEPAITMLERSGAIKVVADAMSDKGTRAVFGAVLPAGCLYTKEEFIRNHPDTVQALTNAIVRALRWLQKASAEDVARTVPPEYLAGDRTLYLAALEKSRGTYSKDGLIPAAGAQALYQVLRSFDPAVMAAPGLSIGQTYDNAFVQKALLSAGDRR
ncbi:MAG TPA: ABC transporter substrate-binding protein [Burkholderiales bacterium]|nr:ABC transporter substrate-binding protein [Burkholderiales bacterium]